MMETVIFEFITSQAQNLAKCSFS